jgi:hypothetical protein
MIKETLMKKALALLGLAAASTAFAVDAPITGNVASKCVIVTDTAGVYGNPTPSVLSTAAADGGVEPIVRYDVISADFYKAVISTPDSFSSSPALNDVVNWTGSVSVAEVTDPLMSAYDTNKRTFNNVTEFDLTVAGTVWFKVSSQADYGATKAFPGGTYVSVVNAECIAL